MNGRPWSPSDEAKLIRLYPDTKTTKLAVLFRRPLSQVYAHAKRLGLKKGERYLAGPDACRLRRGDNVGAAHRFKPGHVPANKGLRRPGWNRGRMRETQFKKGMRPHTWAPIGTERARDGYWCRKMTDTGYPPRDWRPLHILLWEEHYGQIMRSHAIGFVNGDRGDIRLDNLVLLSRADLMRRNSYHNNYPKEIVQIIQLRGALIRKINKRARNEKQD